MAETKSAAYSANDMDEVDDKAHYLMRPNLVWGGELGSPDRPFSTMQKTSFREIYENSVDEALQGFATQISVEIFEDHSFEVIDNGRGLPTDINRKTGKSGIYQALGTLRSGRNFDSSDAKKSTGTNGLGASAVALFSKRFDVTVYRGGKQYELSFKNGEAGVFDGDGPEANFTPITDVSYMKVSKDARSKDSRIGWETGTKIRVWLDLDAYPTKYHYDDEEIVNRLKDTAFLVPNLKITVTNELNKTVDEVTGKTTIQHEVFDFPNGFGDMVLSYQNDQPIISEPVIINNTAKLVTRTPVKQADGSFKNQDVEKDIPYTVAFSYGNGYENSIHTFVNTVNTRSHGSHLTGVQNALVSSFNDRFDSMRGLLSKGDSLPKVDDYLEGLTMVVSIYLSSAPFTSQSKEAISSRPVQKSIQDSVAEDIKAWIKSPANQADLKSIAGKVTTAAKNRQQVQNQRDLQRQKNELKQSSLPESLIDCEFSGTDAAELYICEGDSAKTALKAARNGQINALLGIRGKVINAYGNKNKMSEVLKSKPVQEIIKSLGAGAGSDFDINQVRYGKVFFAVDADVDGNAIAVGLYALFWVLFRPMVEEGRLYKIEPPLFSILTSQGKKSTKYYARDDKERDQVAAKLDKQGIKYRVSRLKGLGEMKEDDLEETAINPQTRIITQVTSKDLEAARVALDIAVGDDVTIRKAWIESSEVEDEELLA